MKTIDEYIRENRDHFDGTEPPAGHFKRFQARLEAQAVILPQRVRVLPYLLRAAAVAILVTLSSLWTWEHVLSPGAGKMTLSDVSPEYRQVETYYVQQVNLMEEEIMEIPMGNDPVQKEMLIEELKNMDAAYSELQTDLNANPQDERVINAMIEHYQRKVEVMNYILSQLKQVSNNNQLNETNDETVRL
ncbi:MAG: hypothetical protein ABR519_05960 [Bacteroidales bacterium]